MIIRISNNQFPKMGNNSKPNTKIPSNFRQTCHPKLLGATINPSQQSLQLHLLSQEEYQQWKWNLYPIKACSKYLMQPDYFKEESMGIGTCQPEHPQNIIGFSITVGYEPFIYTLRKEIMIRNYNNNQFTQKQLWKVLKVTTMSLKYWIHVYEDLSIGVICPQNIIIDLRGRIKLVHLFSFLPDNVINVGGRSCSYFDINPMNTLSRKRTTVWERNQNITRSLNQIGVTLMNMLLMRQVSQFELQNFRNYFTQQNRITPKTKYTIAWLLDKEIKSDKELDEVIEAVVNKKKQQ